MNEIFIEGWTLVEMKSPWKYLLMKIQSKAKKKTGKLDKLKKKKISWNNYLKKLFYYYLKYMTMKFCIIMKL